MNKLLAACAVATAALLAGPTAVAGADVTFENAHCDVYGAATFTSPLMGEPMENEYHFKSSPTGSGSNAAKKTQCSGTLNTVKIVDQPVTAQVDGKGTLSCGSSQASGGPGKLTFPAFGQTLGFTLDIVGFGTEVALVVHGEKSGRGHGQATFRDDPDASPEKAVPTCGPGGGGFTNLDFAAAFDGDETLVSSSPAATGGGGTGGGGTGGGGGGTGGGGGGTGGGGGGGSTGSVRSVVTLRTVAQKLKAALRRGIGATLKGNVPAKATLTLQVDAATARRYGLKRNATKPFTIGRGTINLTRSGQTLGYLKISSAAKRKLRNARRLRVKLVGTIVDVTQRKQTVSKTVTLR
jgi:hypothetical protein